MATSLLQPAAPALQPPDPERDGNAADEAAIYRCGTLLLDVDGAIRFGDLLAAEFFHSTPRALLGQPVTRHLPCLALQAGRHGYNVAYVNFRFAGAHWHRFSLITGNGEACEIGLKAMFFKGDDLSPFFLVQICTFDD
ncbi:MAG TPA: hypothetical protein VF096_06465 [Azonexus sp.]